jgi:2,3-bisphosphoglycerate-dependent phosphoglycerate mutase
MYKIIFLRHGESEGVRYKLLQGHKDFPLTDTGREQITALGRYWQNKKLSFDRILTSPLKRCKETAKIIASHLNCAETIEEPLWIERDFGKGEGADLQIIKDWYNSRPYPSAFEPIYDTGETEWAVHIRAGQAIEKLLSFPEGTYLIVAHGNIINAALHMISGVLPQGRSLPIKMSLAAGQYAKLTYCPTTARWNLAGFN